MKIRILSFAIFCIVLIGCNGRSDDNLIEESGTIEITNSVISAEASGKINKILFSEGDKVKLGDTLLVIDHEILGIKLAQAKAAEKIAKANFELAKKGARSEDKNSAREQLKKAEVNFESAKNDYERFKNLYKERAVTKKQFEDIETRFQVSEAQLKTAELNFKKMKNIVRPEELLKAEGTYEQANAKVAEIKKYISDCFVVAPINGTIIKQFAEEGETVNKMSSLLKISDLSEAEVIIYVAETDLGKVKLGQTAEIKTDTYKDKKYNGIVTFISEEAEFTPKNIQTKDERVKLVFAVKITVENAHEELKSGMPADAAIKVN